MDLLHRRFERKVGHPIYIYIYICVLICLGPFISLAFAGVSRALLGIKQMLPARLGHRSGKVLRGVVKLRFGVFFWGAPSGVQTPSEAGYPSTFYEEFNGPVWVSFRGILFGACLELRIGYFMGLLWLVCIGLQ